MSHKVVAILEDGRRLKGITDQFDPQKPFLLLRRVDVEGNTLGFLDIEMGTVVAAFFVHDLALDRTSRRNGNGDTSDPPDANEASTVRVRFGWGEVVDGIVFDYDPDAAWFFLYPVGTLNRSSNNERVYISSRAVATMEVLPAPAF